MNNLIAWVEIPTENFDRAVSFYGNVFGWNLTSMDFGTEKMALLPDNAGAISQAPGFKPAANGVLVSFTTSNIDKTLEKIGENGGIVKTPRTAIEREEGGHFATFTDCEGNQLGLFESRG
jgi:predicted enzyme related to lactoylglutathione lyase